MKSMKFLFSTKHLLICGIIASLLYIGSDIVAALSWQGYSYSAQTVSELRAVGSPTRAFLIPVLFIYTLLEFAFGLGVWKSAGQKRTLRIAAGFLIGMGVLDLMGPLFALNINEDVGSFTNIIHMIVTALTMICLLLIIGFSSAAADRKWFRYYSIATILIFLVMGFWSFLDVTLIASGLPVVWLGIRERIGIYGYMLWMLIFSLFLLKSLNNSENK
jgi:hypothetical protein